MSVIGMTGQADTPLAETADISIVTRAGKYADRVQELHIKVIHILIELVERRLAPQNYP
jgi:D-sedoheptulose 7-phosphate isomerase